MLLSRILTIPLWLCELWANCVEGERMEGRSPRCRLSRLPCNLASVFRSSKHRHGPCAKARPPRRLSTSTGTPSSTPQQTPAPTNPSATHNTVTSPAATTHHLLVASLRAPTRSACSNLHAFTSQPPRCRQPQPKRCRSSSAPSRSPRSSSSALQTTTDVKQRAHGSVLLACCWARTRGAMCGCRTVSLVRACRPPPPLSTANIALPPSPG